MLRRDDLFKRRHFDPEIIIICVRCSAFVISECDHVVWVGDDTPTSGWHRAKLTATTAVSMAGLPFPSNLARYLPYVMAIEQAGPSNVDLIWAERPHIAKLCAPFLRKTILDLDDLDHIKIARQLKVQGAARGRAVGAYRFAYYRYLEIDWVMRIFDTRRPACTNRLRPIASAMTAAQDTGAPLE